MSDSPAAAELVEEVVTPNGDGPTAPAAPETSPAEGQSHADIFEFARFCHVGPGAETCPKGQDGSCKDPLHFHAWLRLPNQFQHASIREKAMAAKARRIRQLRDPDSDVRVILDTDIDTLVQMENKEALVEEVVGKDFVRDYMNAVAEVTEDAEDDLYKTIDEDRERLRALKAMSEEDRPAEEFKELQEHVEGFTELVQAAYQAGSQPLRESLEERSINEVAEMVREDRIEREGDREFNDTYQHWEWYIGTLKPTDTEKEFPSQRYWNHIDHMRSAAREILEALAGSFDTMESSIGKKLKNS